MIISGTGPRKLIKDPTSWARVAKNIDNVFAMYDEQIEYVISGGAEGFDELLAWQAYQNDIPYDLYIPNAGYPDYYWKKHSVTGLNRAEDFRDMALFARAVYYLYRGIYVDGVHTNHLRNDHMINQADLMIVCESDTPGTQNALAKIREKEVPYVFV